MKKRSRSRGVRNPVRLAVANGLGMCIGFSLLLLGVGQARQAGSATSPLVLLGIFPALLCPFFCLYYLGRVRAFRAMRSGRASIARWVVPAGQFRAFCEEEACIPAGSVAVNFYRPPRTVPEQGVEVIFSDRGVLIDGGFFPLSVHDGRSLQSVRYNAPWPPSLEFGLLLTTTVRTSSASMRTVRASQALRIPVAMDARGQADTVVDHFQAVLRAHAALQGERA
jgi:hypothetical protein